MNSTDLQKALAVVPETAPGTEARSDDRGILHLRRRVEPGNRIVRHLNHWFQRTDYTQAILDAQGTFFWQQIDGRHSLDDIARSLARQFSFKESESHEAVLVYAGMLMKRQLIRLRVPAKKEVI